MCLVESSLLVVSLSCRPCRVRPAYEGIPSQSCVHVDCVLEGARLLINMCLDISQRPNTSRYRAVQGSMTRGIAKWSGNGMKIACPAQCDEVRTQLSSEWRTSLVTRKSWWRTFPFDRTDTRIAEMPDRFQRKILKRQLI